MCVFVFETRLMRATATGAIVEIKGELNCQTAGIIYCITCKKCMMQYIGTSKLTAQARLSNHVGYIRNKNLSQPTGKHFNLRGHSLSDMFFVILEKVYSEDVLLREERESHYIRLFNTKYNTNEHQNLIAEQSFLKIFLFSCLVLSLSILDLTLSDDEDLLIFE